MANHGGLFPKHLPLIQQHILQIITEVTFVVFSGIQWLNMLIGEVDSFRS